MTYLNTKIMYFDLDEIENLIRVLKASWNRIDRGERKI